MYLVNCVRAPGGPEWEFPPWKTGMENWPAGGGEGGSDEEETVPAVVSAGCISF